MPPDEAGEQPGETAQSGGEPATIKARAVMRSPVTWIVGVGILLIAALLMIPGVFERAAAPTPTATREPTPVPMAGCTTVSVKPTPGPTEQSLFPPVSEKDWVRGPMTASVTIIEYSDFQ